METFLQNHLNNNIFKFQPIPPKANFYMFCVGSFFKKYSSRFSYFTFHLKKLVYSTSETVTTSQAIDTIITNVSLIKNNTTNEINTTNGDIKLLNVIDNINVIKNNYINIIIIQI